MSRKANDLAGARPRIQEAYEETFGDKSKVEPDQNALVSHGDGTWTFRSFQMSRLWLVARETYELADFDALGQALANIDDAIQWWIGDWLVLGDGAYGEGADLARQFGYKAATARQYKWVCKSVEPSIRIDGLSFGHHALVAPMEPGKQRDWLERAAAAGWSIKQMREAINAGQTPDLEVERRAAVKWARGEIGKRLARYDVVDDRTLGAVLVELGKELLGE